MAVCQGKVPASCCCQSYGRRARAPRPHLLTVTGLTRSLTAPFGVSGSRRAVKLGLDLVVFAFAITAAYVVRFEQWPTGVHSLQLLLLLPVLPALRFASGQLFGMHRTSWRVFGMRDVLRLLAAVGVVSVALLGLRLVMPWLIPEATVIPLGVIALEGFLVLAGTIGVRLAVRVGDERSARRQLPEAESQTTRRALLVGAGRAGSMAARELRRRPDAGYVPVGFVDDDPTRAGLAVEGVQVLGTTHQVAELARSVGAETIILTMPSAGPRARRAVIERCRATGLPVQTVPGYYEMLGGKVGITKVRPIRIEDLLGRGVVELDQSLRGRMSSEFTGKRIIVTGAGGSIGSELVRQLADLEPERLVLLEANENNLFEIEQEMLGRMHDGLVPCLADIRNADEIDRVFAEHRPHVVFHAAAYKHVPMMEAHPPKAIDNNIRGTRTLAEAAHRYGVERFLLVSTDKAVNPTSIMGASKRVAEMVVHGIDQRSDTMFSAVRFGNVLGSRGSVLHTFRRQIENGGPVTVTHEDITRFFMTIPEAVRLVIQACAIGEGGEVFLLDMGEPVRILDMARQMIRLAGLTEEDVPIEITGLRPGEKMYEELLRYGEDAQPSQAEGIMLATSATVDQVNLTPWVGRLERAAADNDIETIRQMLASGTGYRSPNGVPNVVRKAESDRRSVAG